MRFASVKGLLLLCAASLAIPGAAEARDVRGLYTFGGGTDGNGSIDRLSIDQSGNLYGVTPSNSDVPGTVFMVSQGGTETVLHTFVVAPFESADPTGGVVMDAAGNLYGEAIQGGQFVCPEISQSDPDCGSIYKLATDGTLTTIYSFQGAEDGSGPVGGLLRDGSGNLYGTTKYGGTGTFCGGGCGTVFKLAPDGTKTVLYNFAGQTDGARPNGALIADGQGNLYGTTSLGGQDHGTIFKISPAGAETQLYVFNGTDGNQPGSGVVMDGAGNLYGSTATGGNLGSQFGEVFELSAAGAFSTLHAFSNTGGDGAYPQGNLAMDSKGNLYGATSEGGKGCRSFGCGTVFRITKNGKYSVLASFDGRVARNPIGGVTADGSGNVYGNAFVGKRGSGLGLIFAMKKKN